MRILKKFALTFTTLFLVAEAAIAASAEQLLLRDLAPAIKTFSKEIQVYHYFFAPTVQSESGETQLHPQLMAADSRPQWVQFLIKTRTSAFWDLNNNSTSYVNAGPGMYFAIDPHSSNEFGETALVMRIRKGMKFMTVFGKTALKPDTINALVSEGIVRKDQLIDSERTLGLQNGFSAKALKNMVRPENIEWRKFIINLFTKENIQFVEYWYKSHLAGFCKKANQAAFVYIGTNPEVVSEDEPPESMLYSRLNLSEVNEEEARKINLLNRFIFILQSIREKGLGVAKKLIFENLSVEEMNELASDSYECTRRHL